jgi:hypothetical protein
VSRDQRSGIHGPTVDASADMLLGMLRRTTPKNAFATRAGFHGIEQALPASTRYLAGVF